MPLPQSALEVFPPGSSICAKGTFAFEPRPVAWHARLGWVPNFKKWKPGDLLVMEKLPGGGIFSSGIEAYQKARVHRGAQRYVDCTHCAVYIGDGLIADSPLRSTSVHSPLVAGDTQTKDVCLALG